VRQFNLRQKSVKPPPKPGRWPYLRGFLAGIVVTLTLQVTFGAMYLIGSYRSGQLSVTITPTITSATVVRTPSTFDRVNAQTAMREAAESTGMALDTQDVIGRTLMLASLRDGMAYTERLMQLTLLQYYLRESARERSLPAPEQPHQKDGPALVPPNGSKRL